MEEERRGGWGQMVIMRGGRNRKSEFDEEEWILKWNDEGGKQRKVELFEKVRIGIMDEVEKGTGKRKVRMELR